MNRLEDELRAALARQEPSANFADRVLERISSQGSANPSWWEKLRSVTRAPRLRWVAIGAAVALLIGIALSQYRHATEQNIEQRRIEAAELISPMPDAPDHTAAQPRGGSGPVSANGNASSVGSASGRSKAGDQARLLQYRKEMELKAEGEAARQQLMTALEVASTTLNEALRKGLKGARIRGTFQTRS